jgi:DNA-binding response OmpR family regulator
MAHTILIVDDDPDLVKMLESRLRANGYETLAAYNGKEGLQKVRERKPDLIILDIMMPDLDGIVVSTTLKNDPETKGIPVLFLTCLVQKDEIKSGSHMIGGNLFIAKPFDSSELLSMIKTLLRKP